MDEQKHIAIYSAMALLIMLSSVALVLQTNNFTGYSSHEAVYSGWPGPGGVCLQPSEDLLGPCYVPTALSHRAARWGKCPEAQNPDLMQNPRLCSVNR